MELTLERTGLEAAREEIFRLDMNRYQAIEFSYGGSKMIKFFNFFFEANAPTKLYYKIFSLDVIRHKILIGTSAGAIFLGLMLLNAAGNHMYTNQICFIWKNCQINIMSKFSSLSVALIQKEFISLLYNNLPEKLLKMTLSELKETLKLNYYPYFIYHSFPKLKICEGETSLIDAMFKSSDIFGFRDGGFYYYLQTLPPFVGIHSLVFSVTKSYKHLTESADVCQIF